MWEARERPIGRPGKEMFKHMRDDTKPRNQVKEGARP